MKAPPDDAKSPRRALAGAPDLRTRYRDGERDFSNCNLDGLSFASHQLQDVRFGGASLRGTDLRGANLHRATLRQADLAEANLSGAKLRRSNLRRASLLGAIATKCDFVGADLRAAALDRSNLSGSDLRHAILSNTRLAATDMSGCIFGLTMLTACDIAHATLSGTIHPNPTYIDLETLGRTASSLRGERNQAKVVEVEEFLLRCGLVESDIEYFRKRIGAEVPLRSCFISYSHQDQKFAQRLYRALTERKVRCWMDEHELVPGDDLYEKLSDGIALGDRVLMCCSQASLTSWWVENELALAFEKEQRLMTQHGRKVAAVVPLDLDGYLFKTDFQGRAAQLRTRVVANFQNWNTNAGVFDSALTKIMFALQPPSESHT